MSARITLVIPMRLDIAGYDNSRSDVEDETMMPGKREIGINDHDTGVDRNKSPYTIHFNPFFAEAPGSF